jgi:hypothetical protein
MLPLGMATGRPAPDTGETQVVAMPRGSMP